MLHRIERIAKHENQSIFVSLDDTICQKKQILRHGQSISFKDVDWNDSHADK
jgi:hypothetical protein